MADTPDTSQIKWSGSAPQAAGSATPDTSGIQWDSTPKRSWLGEIGTGLNRFAPGAEAAAAATTAGAQEMAGGTPDAASQAALKQAQEHLDANQLHPEQHNVVTNFLASAPEGLGRMTSFMLAQKGGEVGGGAAGAAAGAPFAGIGAAPGALIGASAGGAVAAGAQQAAEAYHEALEAYRAAKPGDEAGARAYAASESKTQGTLGAAFGAIPEIGGPLRAGARALGFGARTALDVGESVAKPAGVGKRFLTNAATQAPVIQAYQAASGYEGAKNKEEAGLPTVTPWQAAARGATDPSGLVFAGFWAYHAKVGAEKALQTQQILNRADAIPPARQRAVDAIYAEMKKVDPDGANAWRINAGAAVQQKKPISLDAPWFSGLHPSVYPSMPGELGAEGPEAATQPAAPAGAGAPAPTGPDGLPVVTRPPGVTPYEAQPAPAPAGEQPLPAIRPEWNPDGTPTIAPPRGPIEAAARQSPTGGMEGAEMAQPAPEGLGSTGPLAAAAAAGHESGAVGQKAAAAQGEQDQNSIAERDKANEEQTKTAAKDESPSGQMVRAVLRNTKPMTLEDAQAEAQRAGGGLTVVPHPKPVDDAQHGVVPTELLAPDVVKKHQDLQQPVQEKPAFAEPEQPKADEQPLPKVEAPNAVQEPSTSGVLPHTPEGAGEPRGERGGMGPSVEGQEPAQAGTQAEAPANRPEVQRLVDAGVDKKHASALAEPVSQLGADRFGHRQATPGEAKRISDALSEHGDSPLFRGAAAIHVFDPPEGVTDPTKMGPQARFIPGTGEMAIRSDVLDHPDAVAGHLLHEGGHALDAFTQPSGAIGYHSVEHPAFEISGADTQRKAVGGIMQEMLGASEKGSRLVREYLSYPFRHWLSAPESILGPHAKEADAQNFFKQESLAQAVAMYHEHPDVMRAELPKTYAFIDRMQNDIKSSAGTDPHEAVLGSFRALAAGGDIPRSAGAGEPTHATGAVSRRTGAGLGSEREQHSDRGGGSADERRRGEHTLNIGLNIGDKVDALKPEDAKAAIEKTGAKVVAEETRPSKYENTYIAKTDRPLTKEEMHQLALDTQQQVIPQYSNGKGSLHGPGVDAKGNSEYGKFSKREFMEHSGLTPEMAAMMTPAERRLAGEGRGRVAKIMEVMKAMTSLKHFVSAARAGESRRDWYERSLNAIRDTYGEDHPRFLRLMAALSPQTDVEGNFHNAARVFAAWEKAGRTINPAKLRKIFNDNLLTDKGRAEGKNALKAWTLNGIRVLTAREGDDVRLSGPKVSAFMENLLGHYMEVTNDRHMADFAGIPQAALGGRSKIEGGQRGLGEASPTYMALSIRTRQAAKELGWKPAETQAAIWSWWNSLKKLAKSTGRDAEDLLQSGALTRDIIANEPHLGSYLDTDTFRAIDPDRGQRAAGLADRKGNEDGAPAVQETGRPSREDVENAQRADRVIARGDEPGAREPGADESERGVDDRALESNRAPMGHSLFEGMAERERPKSSLLDDLKRTWAPATRGPLALLQAGIMRHNLAKMAKDNVSAQNTFRAYSKAFSRMSRGQQVGFIHNYEHGIAQPTAELQEVSDALHAHNERMLSQLQSLGKLEDFIQNYLGRIWVPRDQKDLASTYARRPLEGDKSFLKQRYYTYFSDGLASGLEPVTYNPIDMMLLKNAEQNRFIYGQKIFREMKDRGLAILVPHGGRPPDGMTVLNDKIASSPDGYYAAPEQAALLFNNHLSPGLRGRTAYDMVHRAGMMLNSAQLGLSLFHAGFTTVDAMVSKAALGVQQLSRGQLLKGLGNIAQSLNPAQPFLNFYKGDKLMRQYMGELNDPDLAPIAEAMMQGGGRGTMDEFYKNQAINSFKNAVNKGEYLKAGARLLPALMDRVNVPIFDKLVPRQKMGVFFDMAKDWLERNEEKLAGMSPEDALALKREQMGKFWDSVDNRMGQLAYDNVFWGRTLKDSLMIAVRSVGWNLGTFRELGGGVLDAKSILKNKELSSRTGYLLALPFVTSVMGAVIQQLYTGQGPQEMKDYFFPRTGRTRPDGSADRVSLPTYMKDIFEYQRDVTNFAKFGGNPVQTVVNKMHPMLGLVVQMANNEDFFGGAIRASGDPVMQQLQDEAGYLVKAMEPFSLQNASQQAKVAGHDVSVADWATSPSMIGITPAPGYITKSDQQLEASSISHNAPALIVKFREMLRDGAPPAEVIARARANGLRPEEIRMIARQGLSQVQRPSTRHFQPEQPAA